MIDSWPTLLNFGLQESVALAVVTVIGYLVGLRTRRPAVAEEAPEQRSELERAARVARQLETIAAGLRQELATHHSQVARFKRRLRAASSSQDDGCWSELCHEAEAILGPTLQLASQLSQAYDQIRKQSSALLTFAAGRTDPLTGVGTVRALEELVGVLLPARSKGGAGFSLALIHVVAEDPEHQASGLPRRDRVLQDQVLQETAAIIQQTMRDADLVARYGADEFAVVMPQTSLAGARVFGERLRQKVLCTLDVRLSCGIAEARGEDTSKTLLGRADSALYSAKAAGGNRQFVHTGTTIKEHTPHGQAEQDAIDRPQCPSCEPEESEPVEIGGESTAVA